MHLKDTPVQTTSNIEPENCTLEDRFPLQPSGFGGPCESAGEYIPVNAVSARHKRADAGATNSSDCAATNTSKAPPARRPIDKLPLAKEASSLECCGSVSDVLGMHVKQVRCPVQRSVSQVHTALWDLARPGWHE